MKGMRWGDLAWQVEQTGTTYGHWAAEQVNRAAAMATASATEPA